MSEIIFMLLDYQEMIDAVERASIESALKRPDSQIIEKPGWYQIITPSVQHSKYNGVIYSVMDEDRADRKIKETYHEYRNLHLPFRWEVGPTCTPRDLRNRLQSIGMILASEVVGMVADPQKILLQEKGDVQVELVTEATASEWVSTSAAGWKDLTSASRSFYFLDDVLFDLREKPRRVYYFLARSEGKAVGTASLRIIQRTGYLQGSSVLPEFRKMGVYSSLVAYRLRFLRNLEIPLATVQCLKETSAPILQRFGFEKICEIFVYTLGES